MLNRPHANPTLLSLARLLAGWLVVIVLVQGLVAVQGRVLQGGLHRHAPPAAQAVEVAHSHDGWQRHHHAESHTPVVPGEPEPDTGMDRTAGLLALAFLGGGWVASALPPPRAARHAWHALPGWFMATRSLPPLRRPPRR
jgi:hypothetical protein